MARSLFVPNAVCTIRSPSRPERYSVEIYHPDSASEVLITFDSDMPLMTFGAGDLLNPLNWNIDEFNGKLLRILKSEHILWNTQGMTKHKILVYTERADATELTRRSSETNRDLRRLTAYLLAQVLRLQQRVEKNMSGHGDARVFGLLHGFESEIEETLEWVGDVTLHQLQTVVDILTPIWSDSALLQAFTGYYDIEDELSAAGVDRPTAIRILTFLNANHQFAEVIKKMDSSNSPSECRTFELDRWDS